MAIVIGFGVLSKNAGNIPLFEQFSQAWDQRHQLVLNKRDSGERLAASVPSMFSESTNDDYWLSECVSKDVTALLEKRYRA